MGKRDARTLLGLCATVAMLAPTAARASTVTVGSSMIGPYAPAMLCGHSSGGGGGGAPCTQTTLAVAGPGTTVASPIDGAIVRWRIAGGTNLIPGYAIQVLRPASGGGYTTVAMGSPHTLSSSFVSVIDETLPIKAGDLIAIDTPANASVGEYSLFPQAEQEAYWMPPLANGSTGSPTGTQDNQELGFNADVQPAPGVNLVNPSSGSITGGTKVVIAGHDLNGATAVTFGSVPASFTVDADTKITATAPKGSAVGPVDVVVTTPAGRSPADPADRFTYEACVVPKLKGKSLAKARKKLGNSDCRLGKVKGSGKVRKPSAGAGTLLPPGGTVNLKLG
jgi:hypothetical protein